MTQPTYDFIDRVAIVTGASSGMGAVTARRFAEAGASVVLADVNESALKVFARELSEAGQQVLPVTCDVSDEQQVAAAVCPCTIDTPMESRIIESGELNLEATLTKLPMRRLGTSDEIASAALWLCSPGASFVTGIALPWTAASPPNNGRSSDGLNYWGAAPRDLAVAMVGMIRASMA